MKILVNESWEKFFNSNKEDLKNILKEIYKNKDEVILPEKDYIFRIFKYFSLKETKLVILGQDPYPGSSIEVIDNKKTKCYYAEGLSFSVNPKITKLPGSLKNIFKELKENYEDFDYKNGSLLDWVKYEKIMLLNTALTVVEGKPNSHSKLWESFTDKVIEELDKNSNCLFLLMGGNAGKKVNIIKNKHRVLRCVHPSPLSAYQGFFSSNIFKKINEKLKENKMEEINWNLNE